MDEETKSLLRNSGLDSYIAVFEQNKIGIDVLADITEDIVPSLITPIGDRIRFQKAVNAWRLNISIKNNVIPTLETTKELNELDLKSIKLEDENIDFTFEDEYNCNEQSTKDIFAVVEAVAEPEPGHSEPSKKLKVESTESSTLSNSPSTSQIDAIRTSTYVSNQLLESKENLEALLKTSTDGQEVLDIFKTNGELSDTERRQLISIIVYHLMVIYEDSLNNSHFKTVAELIVKVFPTECVETYYIAPFTKGVKQNTSKGKLPSKHRNLKTSIKENGVVIDKSVSKQVSSNVLKTENLLPEEQYVEYQTWLKSYNEPWTEVQERWKLTSSNRVFHFTKDNDLTIKQIIKEWPLLKHQLGHTLISIDFDTLFPNKKLELLNNWSNCKDNLINIIKERTQKDKNCIAHQIVNTLPSDVSEDGKDVVAMHMLPTLLLPEIMWEKGKAMWKPTVAECQEIFFLHVKDSVSKQSCLEQRRKTYENLKQPIQPSIIIVGETLDKASDFYVLFEDVEYKLNSALEAVDVCFKILHVLNLVYPPEAYNVWIFLQRYLYKIKIENEKVPTCVSGLMSELLYRAYL